MLQVIVLADGMRGKSTLAAMIARTLSAAGIPIELVDGEPETGDADFLLKDTEGRLARNIGSIAGREALTGGKVLITTQQLGRHARSRAMPAEVTETMRVDHDKPNMIEVDRVREVAAGGSEDVPFPEPTGKKSSFHPGLSMKTVHVERVVPHPRGSGFDGPQGSG